MASAIIHNSHLEAWGVTEKDLYEKATGNIKGILRQPMSLFLNQMLDCDIDLDQTNEHELQIITNLSRTQGAHIPFSCVSFREELSKIYADKYPGAFILPSSIHETMMLLDDDSTTAKQLKALVTEVNNTQVSSEEKLSDSVYYLNFETCEITKAA